MDRLKIGTDAEARATTQNKFSFAKLSPQRLHLVFRGSHSHIPVDYCAFFQSLHTLKLTLPWYMEKLHQCFPCFPQSLQRFHLTICDSTVPLKLHLQNLLAALPTNLVALALHFGGSYRPSPLSLQKICEDKPHLQMLDLKGFDCSPKEGIFMLPTKLTSLAVPVLAILPALSFAEFSLYKLTVYDDVELELKMAEKIDLQNSLPPSLLQLRLTIVPELQTLPICLTSLKVECQEEYLHTFCTRLLLPLPLLRSLSINLSSSPDWEHNSTLKLPRSLTYLHLGLRNIESVPEMLLECFDLETRSSPTLHLEFAFHEMTLESIIAFSRTFPHAHMTVQHPLILTKSAEISLLKKQVPKLSGLCVNFQPVEILRAISDWLNGCGRLHFSMCLCPRCFGHWQPKKFNASKTTQLSVPVACFEGQTLATYGGISFVHDAHVQHTEYLFESSKKKLVLPSSLEALSLVVNVVKSERALYAVDFIGATSLFASLPVPSRLLSVDLGAACVVPNAEFWCSLPRSITFLRSTYEVDPQIEFGGTAEHLGAAPLEQLNSRQFTTLNLVTLDTPYFLYPLDLLPSLVSTSTLTTLRATIKALDTSIFELATCNGTNVFPTLQNIKLRAAPIVTGLVLANYPEKMNKRTIEKEVAQAFLRAGVLVIGCTYTDSITLHPRVTHMDLKIGHNHAFNIVKYAGDTENLPLSELKIRLTHQGLAQFPTTLISLDITIQSKNGMVNTVPHLPVKLQHLKITIADDPLSGPSTFCEPTHLPLESLASTLESIVLVGVVPTLTTGAGTEPQSIPLPHESLPLLPQLSIFDVNIAKDTFLGALGHILPKKTIIKVGLAQFSGLLLPLNLRPFTCETAINFCLDMEKRIENLQVDKWSYTGAGSQVISVPENATILESLFGSKSDNTGASTSKDKAKFTFLCSDMMAAERVARTL